MALVIVYYWIRCRCCFTEPSEQHLGVIVIAQERTDLASDPLCANEQFPPTSDPPPYSPLQTQDYPPGEPPPYSPVMESQPPLTYMQAVGVHQSPQQNGKLY